MLKSPPLNGQFPLIQSFGDNPELYQTVACHGVKPPRVPRAFFLPCAKCGIVGSIHSG